MLGAVGLGLARGQAWVVTGVQKSVADLVVQGLVIAHVRVEQQVLPGVRL